MTREEAIDELSVIYERLSHPEDCERGCYSFRDGNYLEAIDMAIEALSAEPTDLISRAEAHKVLSELSTEGGKDAKMLFMDAHEWIDEIPSANVVEVTDESLKSLIKGLEKLGEQTTHTDYISRADAIKAIESRQTEQWIDADVDYNNGLESAVAEIKALPSADRPSGEWVEKEVMVDEDTDITEWQSAKCSVCGKYHTTPYMYYFDSFNYCPNCGAKMGSDVK